MLAAWPAVAFFKSSSLPPRLLAAHQCAAGEVIREHEMHLKRANNLLRTHLLTYVGLGHRILVRSVLHSWKRTSADAWQKPTASQQTSVSTHRRRGSNRVTRSDRYSAEEVIKL